MIDPTYTSVARSSKAWNRELRIQHLGEQLFIHQVNLDVTDALDLAEEFIDTCDERLANLKEEENG